MNTKTTILASCAIFALRIACHGRYCGRQEQLGQQDG